MSMFVSWERSHLSQIALIQKKHSEHLYGEKRLITFGSFFALNDLSLYGFDISVSFSCEAKKGSNTFFVTFEKEEQYISRRCL